MNQNKSKPKGFFIRENMNKEDGAEVRARNSLQGKSPKSRIPGIAHKDDDIDRQETALDPDHEALWLGGKKDAVSSPSSGDKLQQDEASGTAIDKPDIDHESLPSDRELIQEIQEAIAKENSLSSASKHILVAVKNGKAFLDGKVTSDQEKMTVGDKAAAFVGFGNVHNRLEVGR